jgi:hypothetical protein
VRFYDTETGDAVRDVDTHVWGDTDTPVLDVNNDNALINDCRVHDRLTFQVPEDLAPATYRICVVVPNITGIVAFGAELTSNTEYLNVIPPATARFQIVTERIGARQETSPDWAGSDEVGLRTLAAAFGLDFMPIDLAPQDPNTNVLNVTFKDLLQDVDFDSGMPPRDITRQVFVHDQPILAMLLIVFGDEIDSQGYYDNEMHSRLTYFGDLIKEQADYIAAALTAIGGVSVLMGLGSVAYWVMGIGLALTLAGDAIAALWAPADPLIRDTIALSVNDLASLTSANGPVPEPATFKRENGITVNVNKTIPPIKGPLEYHETREYVGPDSRYEITYRYNRTS